MEKGGQPKIKKKLLSKPSSEGKEGGKKEKGGRGKRHCIKSPSSEGEEGGPGKGKQEEGGMPHLLKVLEERKKKRRTEEVGDPRKNP